MRAAGAAALVLAVVTASAALGCSGATNTIAPTPDPLTETFAGTLNPGGLNFYSFSVTAAGVGKITLGSTTNAVVGAASPVVVGLGLGVPRGTGCSVQMSMHASAALVPQITTALTEDIYCVQISDLGTLTGPVNFAIRIVHP